MAMSYALNAREEERARMVRDQIEARGLDDERVLAAMRAVPREYFVAPQLAESAYDDRPLPIGEGQTVSQPYIVARMAEAASIEPEARVLDIGTGSGYAAAVYAWLADQVYSIDCNALLIAQAERALERTGFGNVTLSVGDGTLGWPSAAPFDAILVAASTPEPPESLKRQLSIGGRLVIPVRDNGAQYLRCFQRRESGAFTVDNLGEVEFVPLIRQSR